jgi:hypothetical protein
MTRFRIVEQDTVLQIQMKNEFNQPFHDICSLVIFCPAERSMNYASSARSTNEAKSQTKNSFTICEINPGVQNPHCVPFDAAILEDKGPHNETQD